MATETNRERIQREAAITDPSHPDYNSDNDITLPGGNGKTYRDAILAGFDPNEDGIARYLTHIRGW